MKTIYISRYSDNVKVVRGTKLGRLEHRLGVSPRVSALFLLTLSIVGSLRDRKVACSVSGLQGLNFESCARRTVSSHSSHHPLQFLLAQYSLYVHKSGPRPDSFYLFVSIDRSEYRF